MKESEIISNPKQKKIIMEIINIILNEIINKFFEYSIIFFSFLSSDNLLFKIILYSFWYIVRLDLSICLNFRKVKNS